MQKIKLVVAGVLLSFGLFVSVPATFAQETGIGSGLSISPTRTDLIVEEGTSADLNISVKNVTGGKIVAKAYINDFEPDGVSGEPRLITDSSVKSAYSIKDFIIGLDDVPLETDESKEVVMQINIPQGASPGAYYGVIRYQAVPVEQVDSQGDGGQVALTASVGTIVLVEVPGNIKQQIEIKNLSAYIDDKKGSFFTKKPNKAGIEIANLGNGFARPFGEITLKDMSGNEVYSYEMNNTNPRGVVLPDSTRLFTDPVENISKPGRYTIEANVSYGNGGEVYNVTSTFWYLPIWLLGLVGAVVLGLVFLSYRLYRKYVTKTTHRK